MPTPTPPIDETVLNTDTMSAEELLALRDAALLVQAKNGDMGAFMHYVFGWEPAWHQQIWLSAIDEMFAGVKADGSKAEENLVIIAPPGCAKTNTISIALPAFLTGANPNLRIGLVSVTAGNAVKCSKTIRTAIEDGGRFSHVYPDVVPNKKRGWGEETWYVQPRNPSIADPNLFAIGMDGRSIGKRFDFLILDDLFDEKNSATKHQREKVHTTVGTTLFSRMVREQPYGGHIVAVMTRWHEDDLMKVILEDKLRTWRVVHMEALGYREKLEGLITSFSDPELGAEEEVQNQIVRETTGRVLARVATRQARKAIGYIDKKDVPRRTTPADREAGLVPLDAMQAARHQHQYSTVHELAREGDGYTMHNSNSTISTNTQHNLQNSAKPLSKNCGGLCSIRSIDKEGGVGETDDNGQGQGATGKGDGNDPTPTPHQTPAETDDVDPGSLLRAQAAPPTVYPPPPPPAPVPKAPTSGNDNGMNLLDGSALWPEQLSREQLLKERATDPFKFARMYQGYPVIPGGHILRKDWWGYYQPREIDWTNLIAILQSYDFGFRTRQENDFTCGFTAALMNDGRLLLLDCMHGKWSFPNLQTKIRDWGLHWNPHVVLLEDTGGGGVTDALIAQLPSLPLVAIRPHQDKLSRATAISGYVRGGYVQLPITDGTNPHKWIEHFLEETSMFPAAAHDDMVDSLTLMVNWLIAQQLIDLGELLVGDKLAVYDATTDPSLGAGFSHLPGEYDDGGFDADFEIAGFLPDL